MAIEIEEVQVQETKAVTVQPTNETWDEVFSQIAHGDFSGLSLTIMIVLGILILRPLLALASYVAFFALIFMGVKYYALS